MRYGRTTFVLLSAAAALILAGRFRLSAQPGPVAASSPAQAETPAAPSIHDALARPFPFAFAKPTPLAEVARHLSRSLGRPVVLDKAALDRLDVRPDDTVELVLDGARLRTGLRLLLDQLDLTYRVETDDNLLILTDAVGANDPNGRVLEELQTLHHEVHELRELLDDVRGAMGLDDEAGARVRKPTIIEDLPPGVMPKPDERTPAERPKSEGRARPGI